MSGQLVDERAVRASTRVTLALGSKSPNVVFDDAVIEGAILGIFAVAGQTRIVGSRLLVQRSAHNEFIDKRVAFPLTAKTGDPTTYDTQVGPVTTPSQYKKILDYIAAGRAEGAQVALGGSRRQGAVWRRLGYRADDLHGCKQQDAARTEGDFRPGAVSRSVGQRRRHRQRHTLWPDGGHGDAGHPAIDHHVGAPARRHCLGSTPVARSVSCHPLGANSLTVQWSRPREWAGRHPHICGRRACGSARRRSAGPVRHAMTTVNQS